MALTEKDINDINKINYIQNFIPSYTATQITVPLEYYDIGNDDKLRENVTKHFQEKILKWMKDDWVNKNKQSLKKQKKFINSDEGYRHIYNLIREFVKNSNANWYELREGPNSKVIKDYLEYKLGLL
jgi:hypothetical protein